MPRVRKGAAKTQARKRLLRLARGYQGVRRKHQYQAQINLVRAGGQAYEGRKLRKRDMRALWITRITAACRMRGTRYSLFMNGLRMAGVTLNRKMLSNLAIEEPKVFDDLVALAIKSSRAVPAKV